MSKANKERLFQDIRREKIVLWAGAGLSLYAGYPSGNGFRQKLYNSLTRAEQRQVHLKKPLPAFAKEFVDLRNRNELVQLVKEEFSRPPTSLKVHQQLASIPYIHDIITTNYDNLFELAYGDGRLDKVLSNENTPYLDSRKTRLYKIHGDLQHPTSIIISSDDYTNLSTKRDKLPWTMIESLLATKKFLFVGYSLEDPNALDLFHGMLDLLGQNMHNSYLVAPKLTPLQVESLKKKGIIYINLTGEQLIAEILEDLNRHALSELESGTSSIDTTGRFLDQLGFNFSLRPTATGYRVEDLVKKEGVTRHNVEFRVQDKDLAAQLRQLTAGEFIGKVVIPGHQLQFFEHLIEGLHFPVDIKEFYIASAPIEQAVLDLQFEDGYTVDQVNVELYGSDTEFRVIARYKHVQFIFSSLKGGDMENMTFTLEHDDNVFTSVSEEIRVFEIVKHLGQGTMFKCFNEEGKLVFEAASRIANEVVNDAEFWLGYFENLRAIERHFGVLFKNVDKNRPDDNQVLALARIIREEKVAIDWDGHYTLVGEENIIRAQQIVKNPQTTYHGWQQFHHNKTFHILGKEFPLEYTELYTFDDLYVQWDKAGVYQLKTRNGKASVQFSNSIINYFPKDEPT